MRSCIISFLLLFVFGLSSAQDPRFPVPSHEDVRYGQYERNVLDLWLAPSESPTPLLIFLHGGGFRQGDKWLYRDSAQLQRETRFKSHGHLAMTWAGGDRQLCSARSNVFVPPRR